MDDQNKTLSKAIAVVSVCVCLLIGSGLSQAQIDMGSVAGTVKDPSGAVVRGAHLTLTNQASEVVQETHSTSTGSYVFEAVIPGVYTLKAEATGFKIFLERGIQVQVQNTVTADVSLALGATTQTVSVTSAAPLL
jgi:hypothetical protein